MLRLLRASRTQTKKTPTKFVSAYVGSGSCECCSVWSSVLAARPKSVSFAGAIATVTGIGTPMVSYFGWKVAAIMILVSLIVGAGILRNSLFTPERIAKANEN